MYNVYDGIIRYTVTITNHPDFRAMLEPAHVVRSRLLCPAYTRLLCPACMTTEHPYSTTTYYSILLNICTVPRAKRCTASLFAIEVPDSPLL